MAEPKRVLQFTDEEIDRLLEWHNGIVVAYDTDDEDDELAAKLREARLPA